MTHILKTDSAMIIITLLGEKKNSHASYNRLKSIYLVVYITYFRLGWFNRFINIVQRRKLCHDLLLPILVFYVIFLFFHRIKDIEECP